MRDEEQVFEVGERTVHRMQEQPFLAEEFGTIVTNPRRTAVPVTVASEPEPATDIERIERKLDALTRAVAALQRRLDSIDLAIARLVSR